MLNRAHLCQAASGGADPPKGEGGHAALIMAITTSGHWRAAGGLSRFLPWLCHSTNNNSCARLVPGPLLPRVNDKSLMEQFVFLLWCCFLLEWSTLVGYFSSIFVFLSVSCAFNKMKYLVRVRWKKRLHMWVALRQESQLLLLLKKNLHGYIVQNLLVHSIYYIIYYTFSLLTSSGTSDDDDPYKISSTLRLLMAPLVAVFTYTDIWTCFAWV